MKPGHIRVFDGLRMTTEHIDHLQGSFHSAVQDLREILGLGRVHAGFEVFAAGEGAVTVQAGLAFDAQKNRIVCDEPKTLEVTFASDEDTQFVCIKYEQVEDNLIEGQPTLIWDSCAILMRTSLPAPEENLIPIAKLIKVNGALEIISLIKEPDAAPEKAAEKEEPQEGKVAEEAEASETSGEKAEIAGEIQTESKANVETDEAPSTIEALPGSEVSPLHPKPWRLQVRQGVVRLATEPGSENYLSTVVVEALTLKLNSRSRSDGEELLFTLGQKEVPLDFSSASLTCQTILPSTFGVGEAEKPVTEEGKEEEISLTEAEEEIPLNLEWRSTAQGEATFTDDAVSQFGLSMIQPYLNSSCWTSELSERGIAHLPFGASLKGSKSESSRKIWDILQHLQLLIRVDRIATPGFKIICHLLWKGEITEAVILNLQTQNLRFTWEALVAWKALGNLQD